MKVKDQQLAGIMLVVLGFIFLPLALTSPPDRPWPTGFNVVCAFTLGALWATGVTFLVLATAKQAAPTAVESPKGPEDFMNRRSEHPEESCVSSECPEHGTVQPRELGLIKRIGELERSRGKANDRLLMRYSKLRDKADALRAALEGLLPLHSDGQTCSYCASGNQRIEGGRHFDADNIWGENPYCLFSEHYAEARAALLKHRSQWSGHHTRINTVSVSPATAAMFEDMHRSMDRDAERKE